MRGGDGGKQEQQAAIAATPLGTTFAVFDRIWSGRLLLACKIPAYTKAEVAPCAGGEPALCGHVR